MMNMEKEEVLAHAHEPYKDKDIIMFQPDSLKHARNLSAYLYYSPRIGGRKTTNVKQITS